MNIINHTMITIKDIINEIEALAPLPLQEGFDNAGVQVGDVRQEASGALLCLDVTEAVVDEAIAKGCNLIISHHPLAFKPFKSLTGHTYIERCLMKACKYDLVVYAAHTNLDNAQGGVNYRLAEMLGLRNVHILSPQKNALLKLVVFVPEAHAGAVRSALFAAGAGHIGNYDACSFNVSGEGTFRAGENCHPFCGEIGNLHHEKELRIETILPAFRKSVVTRALLAAHPYEEPAFDFYPLANTWDTVGSGIVGELPESEEATVFLLGIKELFQAACVKHSALTGRPVRKVAVCGGSGAFLIPEAIAAGADVFITGEARYNDFHDVENKILLAVIGHYETEICTKEIFYTLISKKFPTFALHFSNVNSNPVKYL
jgi:dinuclear metal center YbgI/SA1388 family protein